MRAGEGRKELMRIEVHGLPTEDNKDDGEQKGQCEGKRLWVCSNKHWRKLEDGKAKQPTPPRTRWFSPLSSLKKPLRPQKSPVKEGEADKQKD